MYLGVSQKHMAEKEASVAGKVVEACVLTPSVRRCVFTSSLLACIWRQHAGLARRSVPTLVDESSWSDETLCTEKKVNETQRRLPPSKANRPGPSLPVGFDAGTKAAPPLPRRAQ